MIDLPPVTIARAIVMRDGKLAVHKRLANGFQYYSLPGGHIESEEAPEHAVVREVDEELSLTVTVERVLYCYISEEWGNQLIYLCSYQSGKLGLRADSEEAADTRRGKNTYQPQWLELSQIEEVNILPAPVKTRLLADLAAEQFASEVVKLYDTPQEEAYA